MGINRAQYIQGNDSEGVVLNGSVQGVTAGFAVSIDSLGALSVDPSALPQPTIIHLGVAEAINGSRVTFTLVEYGTLDPVTLTSSSNLAVFLGGVPQLPGDAYTVSSNQVTFSSAPPVGCAFLAITAQAV